MPSSALPSGIPVTYRQQYRRCGKTTCSRCAASGPGHGPYWYAFWWEGGRTRSRYVGKQVPADVAGTADAPPISPVVPVSPASAGAPLRVQTLGRFAVWRGEEAIPSAAWTSRRAATLFKCVVSAPGQRLHREEAGEALWPEGAPATSAGNLRATVHRLRRLLDGGPATTSYLRLEGDMLVLAPSGDRPPDDGWLDATAFAAAARAATAGQDADACRAALACYGGDYLPDDPYADWAAPTRVTLRRQYLDLLLHLATLCGARGELDEAEACLRQVLATEPGHEDAAATLMGLLAAAGRRGDALRVYQALATALEDDLAVTPAAEIMALRARLIAQESIPAGTSVPPRPVHPPGRTNLPTPASSFVGRTWEVGELTDLVMHTRLVTLTGPGGCGKTRLALEVAATQVDACPDGVWLVDLAALADPSLAPRAVATAVGLSEQPNEPLLATLSAVLRARDLLLIVDNCEHLIGACAALVAALLAACPHLRVLATSRERLGVPGECPYLVPSLATPDLAHLPPLQRLATYEAVRLFLERAGTRRPGLTLTAANAGAVAQICARLDGLPLAIELAAARVAVLPVESIAARLDDRFRLLTGGPRTALPRQQTLRAAIDWSHALLGPTEQTLFARLAVFAGGWTLEAAAAVCAADDRADAEGDVLDPLGDLVDKSLVRAHATPDTLRYGFLETVRAYAQERLEASGAGARAAQRHAAYYLALAERAEQALWGPDQASWFRRLDEEQDNLRAALTGALAQDEVILALRLAGALWRFWIYHGDYAGWRRVIETALARATGMAVPADVRAKALSAAGWLAFHQWDYASAAALNVENLRLSRAGSDPLAVRNALIGVAKAAYGLGRQEDAIPLFEEAVALGRTLGHPQTLAASLTSLALALAKVGEGARAEALLEEALALFRTHGEKYIASQAARSLAHLVLARGETERAAALFRESLQVAGETGHKQGLAESLEGVAAISAMGGEAKRAARLFAAAEAVRAASNQPLHPDDRVTLAPYLATARARLDETAWEAAWADGGSLALDRAIVDAGGYTTGA